MKIKTVLDSFVSSWIRYIYIFLYIHTHTYILYIWGGCSRLEGDLSLVFTLSCSCWSLQDFSSISCSSFCCCLTVCELFQWMFAGLKTCVCVDWCPQRTCSWRSLTQWTCRTEINNKSKLLRSGPTRSSSSVFGTKWALYSCYLSGCRLSLHQIKPIGSALYGPFRAVDRDANGAVLVSIWWECWDWSKLITLIW